MIAETQQPTQQTGRRELVESFRRMALEKIDNGSLIIEFLVSAVKGELEDFKPCHRMSASRELIRCVFDFIEEDEEVEAEPVVDPAEEKERLRREEYQRRREEAIEFSLHGPVYYEVYPSAWPCPCEDRRHDCKGNELTEEERFKAETTAPGYDVFIHDPDKQAAYKARFEAYLTRLNPGKDIDFSAIRWRKLTRDP